VQNQAPAHQEFLSFLRRIDKEVPRELDVHLIVDNYCTHKHAKVRSWLAQRSRFHVHYTPTYASWLNQVERWFGIITQRAIRRGSFLSVIAGGFRVAIGADRQNRALHRQLQQRLNSFQLDCDCRFDPGKAPGEVNLSMPWDVSTANLMALAPSPRKPCATQPCRQ
jgi:hypothetical protein